MFYGILVTLHLLVSVILILVVLLQTGKGADLAGAFGGGGSQTAFGSRGAATFLSKLTTGAAIIFMLTSFSLAVLSARGTTSVLDQTEPAATGPTAPVEPLATPPASDEVPGAAPGETGEPAGDTAPPGPQPVDDPGAGEASPGQAAADEPPPTE